MTRARDLSNRASDFVSVKDFGAVGDGMTDDTEAINNAIDHASIWNKALVFPEGRYAITQIDTKNYTCTWYFEEAELLAIGTTTLTCAVKVRSFNSKFYGMKVNLNNKLNYSCAIWWYDAATPSQYNSFFGLTIMQAWRGLVYGEFPGSTSTSLAQSENAVFGFQCYGVWQPLIMNHVLGVITFSGGQLVCHSDTWGATFDNTNNFAFIAYAGCLTLEGCEIQNSIAATTSYGAIIQGGEVYLNGCITEFDVPFQVSGLLNINGGRILNTQSVTDMFYVASNANSGTKIKVNDCYIYRAANVGSFSSKNLVSNAGSSQNIEILFNNCDICEWASFVPLIKENHQSAVFNNCRWYPDGTKNAYLDVYKLDTIGQDLLDRPTIDTKGYTADGFYQNTWYGGGTTFALNADVPNSYYVNSLQIAATGQAGYFTADGTSLTTLKSTAVRVKPYDKFIIEGWFKIAAGTAGACSIVMYDSTGTALTTPYLTVFNETQGFMTTSWKYLRNVVEVPSGSASFGSTTALTGVTITGTAGQFSCTASTLSVGMPITISGTFGGTGSISGYSNPNTYYIIATNGTTTFTLSNTFGGSAITTTAGTPTGLTYTAISTVAYIGFGGSGTVSTIRFCGLKVRRANWNML